ncbi:MAG: hypothetical protein P0116_03000 [Candidatus Nitrosocosmicus sp.]|nr:hypothetical protein [Candidatus Nitrosocosmicus sp.]
MTPVGKRVQTINPPGSEVGPGAVATWGTALKDEVDAMVLNGKERANLANIYRFLGKVHK